MRSEVTTHVDRVTVLEMGGHLFCYMKTFATVCELYLLVQNQA